jgi:hypothetical protein
MGNCASYCISEANSEFKHKVTVEQPSTHSNNLAMIGDSRGGEFEIDYSKPKGYASKGGMSMDGGDKVGSGYINQNNGSQYTGERVNGKKHGYGE